MKENLIVIPCRMNSTRLPGKPLLKFNGLPMVIRIARIASSAGLGDVVIGCCDAEVYDVAKKFKVNVMFQYYKVLISIGLILVFWYYLFLILILI